MGKPCYVFDIDGTLANLDHRLHWVNGDGPKNWNKFFEEMGKDTPIKPIVRLAMALQGKWADGTPVAGLLDADVICCSGRPENYREVTERWLKDNGVYPSALYMRPANDTRPDNVVKEELLHKILEDGWEPILVVDDRQSVVDMWRENGLTVLQCAPDDVRNTRKDLVGKNLLWLMVGPSGAGKSRFIEKGILYDGESVMKNALVLSSDEFRENMCGDFKDQSKNRQVFEALHATAKTAMKHGLAVVIDATNLRRQDRLACVACAPAGTTVTYVVIDRPLEDKIRDAGWRANVIIKGESLVEKHHKAFKSALSDILKGDEQPNVIVMDLRAK